MSDPTPQFLHLERFASRLGIELQCQENGTYMCISDDFDEDVFESLDDIGSWLTNRVERFQVRARRHMAALTEWMATR